MNKFSLFNKLNHWIPTRWSMVRKKAVHCKFNSTLPWHFAWHFAWHLAWHSWHSCHSCHISLALFCVRPSFELSPDDPSVRRGLQQVRHFEPVAWGLSDHSQSYSRITRIYAWFANICNASKKLCCNSLGHGTRSKSLIFRCALQWFFTLFCPKKPLSHVTGFKLQCSS